MDETSCFNVNGNVGYMIICSFPKKGWELSPIAAQIIRQLDLKTKSEDMFMYFFIKGAEIEDCLSTCFGHIEH